MAWDVYKQAKRLLRQSVELYLLERLCGQIASGDMTAPPFDPLRSTPNTLILVDLKEEFEIFLRKFEKICTGRAKLAGTSQMACFYALLVLSVTKSMLTDAHSLRAEYEMPNPWSERDAMRIASAYKAMVSVFCWSSKHDVVLQATSSADSSEWLGALEETRSLVEKNLWTERGIKGSKEFLLGLGSCFYADGSYNGFLLQRYGLETLGKSSTKPVGTLVIAENISKKPTFHVTTSTALSTHSRQSSSDDTVSKWILQTKAQLDAPKRSSSFVFVGQDDEEDHSSGGRSRRKGALNPTSLENAREVRRYISL